MTVDRRERTLMVLEVSRDVHEVPLFYRVVLALPNSEHKLSRVWTVGPSGISAPQMSDLFCWINEALSSAITEQAHYPPGPQDVGQR